jgi:hypothetical protein
LKKVVIFGVKSGKEIKNVKVLEFSVEEGKIAFQPQAGETEYYVYIFLLSSAENGMMPGTASPGMIISLPNIRQILYGRHL